MASSFVLFDKLCQLNFHIRKDDQFNPGKFLEDAREFSNPETQPGDRMFVKPILNSKFDVWDPKNEVLFFFRNCPLEKNKVCQN